MSDTAGNPPRWRGSWLNRFIARPGFQSWASKFPLTRGQARRDGAVLFNVVQGFVQSQVLMALVELDILHRLRAGPQTAQALGLAAQVPPEKMQVLLQAAAALKLLKRDRAGRFGLARKGAALMGVPGLEAMIRHHHAFYADMADPVALLRDPGHTALSEFWPYVFGAKGDIDPEVAETYSDLMSQSQQLVAEDTLRAVSFADVRHLMDVGGGTGAFLAAVGRAEPHLRLTLFDLPEVTQSAAARFETEGLQARAQIHAGSFRDSPLPHGADMISLIRVLYDHADETVADLLGAVFEALPAGGRLLVSEPMGGGSTPDMAGDVYFAFYTMAMKTGRTRSADEIAALCAEAGFEAINSPKPARNFVTRVLTASKPR
ncbi:methyltransferase [uncultured Roseobacter sp.]|uniref:methyltransferase n=1 Tax=uncultured Roseobacter sp. TaxID=114847 RepID=UPI0026234E4F|nr:methyltransferase [uncultured Roseobacter sp.]